MFAWLASINKAWVSGVVSFICVYVLLPFFHITVDDGTQKLIVAVICGVLTAVPTWAIPNKPNLS